MIRASPVTLMFCLGACEPVLSLACGVSPELRSVLRARLSDSFVLEAPGRRLSDQRGGEIETIVARPAALDVHRAQVTACARVPDGRVGASSMWRSSRARFAACWRCATG